MFETCYALMLSLLPIVFGFYCFVCDEERIREYSLLGSFLILNACNGLFFYKNGTVITVSLLLPLKVQYSMQVTYLSVLLVELTALLISICIVVSWVSIKHRLREFLITLFVVEFFLFQVFLVDDILLFYFFYECVVLPVFFLIIVWGSRERRITAAFEFFFFTFLGSILMLVAILFLYHTCGSTSMIVLRETMCNINEERLIFIWLALFLAFAVKAPMVPVHSWLPEAHVEAPTAGSVLLAGILLKMGLYGMYKFLIVPLPELSRYFFPLVVTVAVFSLIYISLIILVQIDLKKIIAYASIAHMNFVIIGLFTCDPLAISGALYLLLVHGVISSGLFICVGILYDRYKTRVIHYYSGLDRVMPGFSVFFFVLILGNFGFPFTGSFVSEFLLLLGTADTSPSVVIFMSVNILLGAVYSIWLFVRIMFGNLNKQITEYCDLNRREAMVLILLAGLTVVSGLNPALVNLLD